MGFESCVCRETTRTQHGWPPLLEHKPLHLLRQGVRGYVYYSILICLILLYFISLSLIFMIIFKEKLVNCLDISPDPFQANRQ